MKPCNESNSLAIARMGLDSSLEPPFGGRDIGYKPGSDAVMFNLLSIAEHKLETKPQQILVPNCQGRVTVSRVFSAAEVTYADNDAETVARLQFYGYTALLQNTESLSAYPSTGWDAVISINPPEDQVLKEEALEKLVRVGGIYLTDNRHHQVREAQGYPGFFQVFGAFGNLTQFSAFERISN